MDYTEARTAFFAPRPADARAPGAVGTASPARALRDAVEPLATIGYWAEPAYDEWERVGLDFLGGYVWGRGCALGEPEPAVVAAAFGVFEPGLVAGLYDASRAACSLADARARKERGAVESLRQVLGEPEGLDGVLQTLRRGIAAADGTGRPFTAGLLSQPEPESPLGRLWHACAVLREYRGDGHLAACVTEGLSGLQANLLTELAVGWEPQSYTATRGWSPEAMDAGTAQLAARGLVADGALTEQGRAVRADVEARTDASVQPVMDALGDDLPELVETLDGWAGSVVQRGWFPPDPYKRASG